MKTIIIIVIIIVAIIIAIPFVIDFIDDLKEKNTPPTPESTKPIDENINIINQIISILSAYNKNNGVKPFSIELENLNDKIYQNAVAAGDLYDGKILTFFERCEKIDKEYDGYSIGLKLWDVRLTDSFTGAKSSTARAECVTCHLNTSSLDVVKNISTGVYVVVIGVCKLLSHPSDNKANFELNNCTILYDPNVQDRYWFKKDFQNYVVDTGKL